MFLNELTTDEESVRIINRLRIIVCCSIFALMYTTWLLLWAWGMDILLANALSVGFFVTLLLLGRIYNVLGPKQINGTQWLNGRIWGRWEKT
jgi:hypothetical protein